MFKNIVLAVTLTTASQAITLDKDSTKPPKIMTANMALRVVAENFPTVYSEVLKTNKEASEAFKNKNAMKAVKICMKAKGHCGFEKWKKANEAGVMAWCKLNKNVCAPL